ncbi:hemicentin-1-like isoform X2 [Montipora foliosa]|uniref:hemicentin-1-like isoform X2 n=1 Tax=Montipora foliosa TaxID=591990 RepID=UPI0035F173F9
MALCVRFFALLFPIFLAGETESQTVTITSKPPSLLRVLEGESLTLEWTYIIAGEAFERAQLTFESRVLAFVEVDTDSLLIRPPFLGRLTANATATNATITLSALSRTDSGTYTFAALGALGSSASEVLEVVVQYPPSLIARAQDYVVLEGDPDIELNCTVDGVPEPKVTWTKVNNGSDSDILFTGEVFELPSNRSNEGTYRCNASNGIGNDVNRTFSVVVNFKPENFTFKVESTNENICKGDTFNITCSAEGSPAVHTYQLFEDGVLVQTSNNYSGLFWNKETTVGGTLLYTCDANNTVATANTTRNVTVNVGSVIWPLENITVMEGTNTILNCSTAGFPMPSVSWLEVKTGNRSFENPLVLSSVSRDKAGKYKCEASNVCKNDTKSLILTVNFKADIVDFVANATTVCQNDVVSFNCSAVGNPAVHTYLLYINGIMTDSNSLGVWTQTMTTGGMVNFTCVANNSLGTDRRTIAVTVNVAASIQPNISGKVVREGSNVTLFCNASGIPEPLVSWVNVRNDSRTHGKTLAFENITRHQAGEYRCEASNPCGNDTESATIDVQYPPEGIQLHVSEEDVCDGTTISFNCSAETANPMELNYQLHENNVMIGVISSTGVWNKAMTVGGVFVYKCMVNNSVGTAMSSTVSVNVNVSSSIQPISDKVVREGSNVTLFCNASGIPEPLVSWLNVRNDSHTHGKTLAFENITRYQAGEYRCEASNPCGNDTESATIDVQFKPELVQLVTSETTACIGDYITFNCSANSNPAVHTYQLHVNGMMVNETSTTGVWNRIMTTRGEFVYKCMVNNSVGTAMSTDVTITVNVPSFIQPIDDETIIVGGNVTLTCNASGFPTPNVSWVKTNNGQRTNGTELVLTNIRRDQAGEYRCEASNLCNTATELATVDVQFKPEMVVLDPSATTVCRGDIIVFNCSAYSNPEVHTYELYVNGTMVNEIGRMGIWNITMATRGVFVYKCMVNNTIGTAMSMNVSVTVNEPPSIRPFTKKEIIEGGNATIMCEPTGTPPLTVSWVKTSGGKPTNGTELVFTHINRIEAGEYRCEASNLCGNASESVEIDVLFKPEMVQLFASETTACNGTSINFTCSADSNPIVHTYHLYENGNMVEEISSSGVWTRTMSTGGEFVFKCKVNNTVGTAMSANVSVNINVSSSIEAIKGNKTLTEGENLNLSCQASGDPLPFVSWIIVGGGQHTNSNLVLTNIQRNQSGEYRCEASNPCNVDTKVVTVDVQYQPEITYISARQTVNSGNVVNLNCTADGNPAAMVHWTRLSDNSDVTMPLAISGKEHEGNYRCTASNSVGSVSRVTSIVVNFPAVIVPLVDRIIVQKDGNVTLFCNASGAPPPSVMWTHVPTGRTRYSETWLITDIQVSDLGEYRCDANNTHGHANDSVTIQFEGGNCETNCTTGKVCLALGIKYFCRCPDGKTGRNCQQQDTFVDVVEVGFEFTNQEFKPEYKDLKNTITIALIRRIEEAIRTELNGTGLLVVSVKQLRSGSVIADVELKFNRRVGEGAIAEVINEALKDNKLGNLDVGQSTIGGYIPEPEQKEECSQFFEGPDCKQATGALIALIVVAVVVVVALLIAIVACSLQKKNATGQGSVQNGKYSQRQDPEGHGTVGKEGNVYGGVTSGRNGHGSVNTGFEDETAQAGTPMVTFNSNNAQTPGITLNDSRSQKARPGEGTYADLGDFQQTPSSTTVPTGPLKRGPKYEETPYAEITQFLQGPVEPEKEESPEEVPVNLEGPLEEPEDDVKDDALNNLNDDARDQSNEQTNAQKLYPSLKEVDGGNKPAQFEVSI